MVLFRITVVLVALLTAFAGCASLSAVRKNPFHGYPFRHDDFDFRYAWKTTPAGQGIVVDGILMNVRYYQVDNMQLWVKVLNKEKKVIAERSTLFLPLPVDSYDYRPFSVKLDNVALSAGDMLKFTILYRVNDDYKSSSSWLSSFTVDAITGALTDKEKTNSGY
jgi:hypothetical protein